jgi:hypothetical protein
VQVPCSEGIANHTGPESCAGHCEVLGEALTGVRTGQPLSRERISNPGADVVRFTEGNTAARAIRKRTTDPAWSQNLARTHLAREPGDLQPDRRRLSRPGGPHREGEEP